MPRRLDRFGDLMGGGGPPLRYKAPLDYIITFSGRARHEHHAQVYFTSRLCLIVGLCIRKDESISHPSFLLSVVDSENDASDRLYFGFTWSDLIQLCCHAATGTTVFLVHSMIADEIFAVIVVTALRIPLIFFCASFCNRLKPFIATGLIMRSILGGLVGLEEIGIVHIVQIFRNEVAQKFQQYRFRLFLTVIF